MKRWYADLAWLGGQRAQAGVLIEADGDLIRSVTAGAARPPEAVHLAGLTLPGLANAHSHAFHRALRGRTQGARGTFWSWREQMYAVSERLDPDTYYSLARATYAEMALAGVTCVGEFHYLHHGPGGTPYADPNAMGAALLAAAADAGIRITLLDTSYLAGGFDVALAGQQLRFGDRSAEGWAARVAGLPAGPQARIGAAIHSVRAVPAEALGAVAAWARERGAPLHVHVSEQPAENADCLAAHGCTPVELLHEHGVLGPESTAVHATHLRDADVSLLAATGTAVCLCPTTERDLADGIGPARVLADAGVPLCLGSDSHAVIDLLEEARAVELDERLARRSRGHWRGDELLVAACAAGHAALGWPEAGWIEAGSLADFVTVDLTGVRTAGVGSDHALDAAVFAATAADIRDVVVGGQRIVEAGRHASIGDVAGELSAAISAVGNPPNG
ncbi:MAG: formimidoylglutamate deiminase [Actinomycetota bacterium]|nr:formimidoylglutamate deiminase [Actinomycetota bacterium]